MFNFGYFTRIDSKIAVALVCQPMKFFSKVLHVKPVPLVNEGLASGFNTLEHGLHQN